MSKTKEIKPTPLMQQYYRIKTKYKDAILLFRVGDFYETFGEDAIQAAKILGIVQTKRHNGSASEIELAGFPHHSLDTYLPKLVRAGLRVAICDQLEEPSKTKKIVKRGVTELVTPGVALNDNLLDTKHNNFLASIFASNKKIAIALIDISTGEFLVSEGHPAYISKLIQSYHPAEIIYPKSAQPIYSQLISSDFYSYQLDDWIYTDQYPYEVLTEHFQISTLKGFGIEQSPEIITAAGAALHYFNDTEHNQLQHLKTISRITQDKYVWLDKFSIRSLELIDSQHHDATTLLDVLDHTTTAMGARLLRKWIVFPLINQTDIERRLSIVDFLVSNPELRKELIGEVKKINDLERLLARVAAEKVSPREVVQLKRALLIIEPIKESLSKTDHKTLQKLAKQLDPCTVLIEKLDNEVEEEAPIAIQKGNTIKPGVSEELDEYRTISVSGKDQIIAIQQEEAKRTGIASLKVGFNNVFGYYLEVRNTYKSNVPETWIRKQTLTSAERYITEELKVLEQKILSAQDKITQLEQAFFIQIVKDIQGYIEPIQTNASTIAELDCLLCFAEIADRYSYCKPVIDDSLTINIQEGRHPVIEQQLPTGEAYIPNDLFLSNDDQQIIMITGPNMSGKSAILRQTALIVLMAQMGSFVPAKSASIGYVDKIFTRVGASDNISSGESTFMVEMNETANIVNNISNRSLILLDEIGRGTSTYDGISIAWSIAEYLHNHATYHPKTLFATHYHELNELAEKYPRIKNYNISTQEIDQKVIFLRKLVPGGSKHSFGIHVANMAGMPKEIVERANELLALLEQKHIGESVSKKVKQVLPNYQLNIFEAENSKGKEVIDHLNKLDINTLTPIEALVALNELMKMISEE